MSDWSSKEKLWLEIYLKIIGIYRIMKAKGLVNTNKV